MCRKLFCILMAFIAVTLAGYYDSGMQTITQPNGVIFQARLFGDGDRTHYITDDSYEITRNIDGYYYYAVLDSSENTFVPTQYKVGIDFPCSASYQLEYLEDTLYYSQSTYSPNGNYRIGIVLVEFSDRKHYEDNNGNGYLKSDFERMMFSDDGSWNTTETGATNPEEREVFGSLKEYYEFQTNGKVTIDTSSCVILTPTGNLWHELTGVFNSYKLQDIITELGLNGAYYDNYDKICIIHAGDYLVYSLNSATIDARCNYWDTYPIGLNYGSVNHNPPMQYFIPSNAFAKSINGLENEE